MRQRWSCLALASTHKTESIGRKRYTPERRNIKEGGEVLDANNMKYDNESTLSYRDFTITCFAALSMQTTIQGFVYRNNDTTKRMEGQGLIGQKQQAVSFFGHELLWLSHMAKYACGKIGILLTKTRQMKEKRKNLHGYGKKFLPLQPILKTK